MQQADCKRCQQQINDNHQDELISSTTVKQPTDAIDSPPPLFSSAGEERGGVGVCPGLINEQEKILKPYLSFLWEKSSRKMITASVWGIPSRNGLKKWYTNKQRKIEKNIYQKCRVGEGRKAAESTAAEGKLTHNNMYFCDDGHIH